MFDYASGHEVPRAADGEPAGSRRCPVTEPVPKLAGSHAARRQRAVADRSATLGAAAPGRRALVVLLPSADAATILLLCEEAADLTS